MLVGFAVIISFLLGYELSSNKEKITYDLYKYSSGNIDWVESPVESPQDRISESQISVMRNKIEIDILDAEWSSYEPTGSMEPLLSEKANGLYVIPKGPEDIKPGDIVAYSVEGRGKDIVHRVIEVEKDEHGNYYYTTKGDANPVPDPELVPYQNIKRVLIGVIY